MPTPSKEEIFGRVRETLVEALSVEEDEVTEDATLTALNSVVRHIGNQNSSNLAMLQLQAIRNASATKKISETSPEFVPRGFNISLIFLVSSCIMCYDSFL